MSRLRIESPLECFFPTEAQQDALRKAMEGRISGFALHTLSAVQLFELRDTPEYRAALSQAQAA